MHSKHISHCRAAVFIVTAFLIFTQPFQSARAADTAQTTSRRFDFGAGAVEPGYTAVGPALGFTAGRGYGWLTTDGLLGRDRSQPDTLRRDFVFGKTPHTFRIAGLTPGLYRVTIVSGDFDYGDHGTVVRASGGPANWPVIKPGVAEFDTLTATVNVTGNVLDFTFSSAGVSWVVNALTLEPATEPAAVKVEGRQFTPAAPKSGWQPVLSWPDPTKPLLARFRQDAATHTPPGFRPTGLTRANYLSLIAGEVDFWKTHQDAQGAIIDPYRKVEFQYSTPAFALAAAALVAWNGRADLLEPAAKALDWSALTLSRRQAATGHEDFFAPLLAHAIPLLKSRVAPERAARWAAEIRSFDPFRTYRATPGSSNWNVVALSGEAQFQQMGLRDPANTFVEYSLAGQGAHFGSPYGLYLEGPMPYDHFPRLWAADMLAQGYTGPYHAELDEVLRRASITSLFMQSPWGELPAGGRSAHHQWNEAEQCVTYEIYAARALRENDPELAGIFKRAAHLALGSMRRWVRPSGEMQIIKNWVDPAKAHAFEGYSAHSQYNLLPMGMLAIAYDHAAPTENIPERPAPAEVGGFVFTIAPLHKVFANAGGTYIEIDTSADHHYDATGLIRVHSLGLSPQLGPSDSVIDHPAYRVPKHPATSVATGIGVSWHDPQGRWRRLGELGPADISRCQLGNVSESPDRVSFTLTYQGRLFGVSTIIEHYTVTPGRVELTTELPGYRGPLRYVWPVLADDGRTSSAITVQGGTVSVSQDGGRTAQTFTPVAARRVQVERDRYPNHNGWARFGMAEYPQGGPITLVIAPRVPASDQAQ